MQLSKSFKHAFITWVALSALLALNVKACSSELDKSYAYEDLQNQSYQRDFDDATKKPVN